MNRVALIVMGVAVAVLFAARPGSGQGFQGGLRGSVKDAGGVVPGARSHAHQRSRPTSALDGHQRARRIRVRQRRPRQLRRQDAVQGYKTIDRGGIRIGTQPFLVLDLTLEVGAISRERHRHRAGAADRNRERVAGHGARLGQRSQTLPAPGRAAFLIGVSIPTVIPSGDGQFNRQQDQTNASLLSLGGGTRRGNNYVLDGVPITDLTNRAVANPSIEALDDVKVQVHTYDAEMGRTGGGVFNTTLKSGTNNLHGTGFFQTRPRLGRGEQLLRRARPARPKPETKSLPAGRRLRRPDRARTGPSSGSPARATTTCRRAASRRCFRRRPMRQRRLLAPDQRRRAARSPSTIR